MRNRSIALAAAWPAPRLIDLLIAFGLLTFLV